MCINLIFFYPHTGNGGHSWCLSISLSLSVGFSIQDESTDVARSAPQGSLYYHADVNYWEYKRSKVLMIFRVRPTPTRFPTNSLYTPIDNTTLHSISSVCHPWGRSSCTHTEDLRPLSLLKVPSYARWKKDWVKISHVPAHSKGGWEEGSRRDGRKISIEEGRRFQYLSTLASKD